MVGQQFECSTFLASFTHLYPVTAVVWAGLPGQEAGEEPPRIIIVGISVSNFDFSGNALVDVLYGDVNPSGRLPYTIAKNASDYSAVVIYEDNTNIQIDYSEGLQVDYRHFDAVLSIHKHLHGDFSDVF